jgi:hypothetical protein
MMIIEINIRNMHSSGILKVPPPSQMLFNKDSQLMEDEKTLAEYGFDIGNC